MRRLVVATTMSAFVAGCHGAPPSRVPADSVDSEPAADVCVKRADYACAMDLYGRALRAKRSASGQPVSESTRRRIVSKLRGMVDQYAPAAELLSHAYSEALVRITARRGSGGSVALDISLVAEIGVATLGLPRLVADVETIRRARVGDTDTPALVQGKIGHVLVAVHRYEDAARFTEAGVDYILNIQANRPELEPFAIVIMLQEVAADAYEVALARGDIANASSILDRSLSKYPDTLLVEAFSVRARNRSDKVAEAKVREIAARYHVTSSVLP